MNILSDVDMSAKSLYKFSLKIAFNLIRAMFILFKKEIFWWWNKHKTHADHMYLNKWFFLESPFVDM